MPALHAVQGICGNWLPLEALKLVSEGMDIPYPYLYGVMSFYTMFSPTPRGKYLIRLCESPPCHIMGAENLVEVLKAELGIKVGETTADGLFTLEHTACLGVCEVAPAMQINEVVHRAPDRGAGKNYPGRLPGGQGPRLPAAPPHHQSPQRLPRQSATR